ncbi:MAG: hypothetical protein F6K55_16600 [Moorea sp. SIO4A3]|nr:hypothetical protein [Moorena sp. SIO4A3]
MGRVGSVGRWGDGEIGEIFIKGNYPDMILVRKSCLFRVDHNSSLGYFCLFNLT